MTTTPLNLILITDSPVLDGRWSMLAGRLEAVSVGGRPLRVVGAAEAPEGSEIPPWQAGDLVVALFAETDPEATIAAVDCCFAALRNRLHVLPLITHRNPVEAALAELEQTFLVQRSHSADEEDILAMLEPRLRELLELRSACSGWFPDGPDAASTGAGAYLAGPLELLRRSPGASTVGQLAQAAFAHRLRAARMITGDSPEEALAALEQAANADAMTAIVPYWTARLGAARNQRLGIEEALRDAVRAARLAQTDATASDLESASWRLAAFLSALLGDDDGVREYLAQAAQVPAASTRGLIAELRIFQRAGLLDEALTRVETAAPAHPNLVEFALRDARLGILKLSLRERAEANEAARRARLARLDALAEQVARDRPQPAPGDAAPSLEIPRAPTDPQAKVVELLEALRAWAQDLARTFDRLDRMHSEASRLRAIRLESPPRNGWDDLLEALSAKLKNRRREVEAARRQALARIDQLATAERALRAQWEASVDAFAASVAELEKEAHGVREDLVPLQPTENEWAAEIVFLTASEPSERGTEIDPELLPRAMLRSLGRAPRSAPGARPGIYAVVSSPSGQRALSRHAVYFSAANPPRGR